MLGFLLAEFLFQYSMSVSSQTPSYSPILVSQATVDDLSPGSILLGKTCILPISLDFVQKWRRCYLEIGVNLADRSISNTSTIALYCTINYYIYEGTYAGKWLIDWNPDDVLPVSLSPLYDGKDPLLQSAIVIVPGGGDFYWKIPKIDLVERKTYRESDGLVIDDASKLLIFPGYFVVAPYYAPFDSRVVMGAGVSDANIYALNALTNVALLAIPSYGI